jgi:hypothetical protein
MKMDIRQGDGMDRSLGFRQEAQNGERMLRCSGRKFGPRDTIGQRFVTRVPIMTVMRLNTFPEPEAQTTQASAQAFFEGGLTHRWRQNGRGICQDTGLELRFCVYNGGSEHVARNATRRIELDAHALRQFPGPVCVGMKTGTT